jgi:ATP-binding cassette subfamily B protein
MGRKTWTITAFVLVAATFDSVFLLASPKVVQHLIDQVYYQKNYDALIPLTLLFLGIGLLSAFFRFLQRYLNEFASQSIIYDLRNELYSKIQTQSIDFFDRIETGQLISRGTSDVNIVRRFLSIGVRIFVRGIMLYTGIFILIGTINWQLLLVVLGMTPILFISMFAYAKRVRPLSRQIQQKFGDMNSVLAENVHGAQVIRAFNAENHEIKKFDKENQLYLNLNMKMARLRAYITTIFPFLLTIGSFFLIYIGGRLAINGILTIGSLIAVNSYLLMMQRPTRFLAFAIIHFQDGSASLQRIFNIIDAHKQVQEKPDSKPMPSIKGKIEFKNVVFSYVEDSPPVLNDVSLTVQPEETVAFLGTTGSGKSTIVSLVPRFYDPQEGKVLIDGINIKDVTLDSLRNQIALVQQEAFLFARTVKENIAFGKEDATDEEIIQAAKTAQAHGFISRLSDGYDTIIGERGVTLSGGQKQRLTIARALLLDCPILIMDDSSSALDFDTEHQFQKAIDELIKDKTTLIVTQRLSTIKYASLIVVMDKGEIVEKGTHKELIKQDGLYRQLYETQLLERTAPISKKGESKMKPQLAEAKEGGTK